MNFSAEDLLPHCRFQYMTHEARTLALESEYQESFNQLNQSIMKWDCENLENKEENGASSKKRQHINHINNKAPSWRKNEAKSK